MITKEAPHALAPAARELLQSARTKLEGARNSATMAERGFLNAALQVERRNPNVSSADVDKARTHKISADERVTILAAVVAAAEDDLRKAEAADALTLEERNWSEAAGLQTGMIEQLDRLLSGLREVDDAMLSYLTKAARLNDCSPVRQRPDVSQHFAPGRTAERLQVISRRSLLSLVRAELGGAPAQEAAWRASRDLALIVQAEKQLISWFSDRNHRPAPPSNPEPPAAALPGAAAMLGRSNTRRVTQARGLNS